MRRAVLALALAALAGCGSVPDASPPAATPAAEAPAAGVELTPTGISIPSIGAESSLIPLGLDADGGWAEPSLDTPGQASWFEPGPEPGETGRGVVLGHVNGRGQQGVFARLTELGAGDEIVVTSAGGVSTTFAVTRTDRQLKVEFPTDEVLAPTDGRELVLITCGGDLDRAAGSYLSSVIVFAEAV